MEKRKQVAFRVKTDAAILGAGIVVAGVAHMYAATPIPPCHHPKLAAFLHHGNELHPTGYPVLSEQNDFLSAFLIRVFIFNNMLAFPVLFGHLFPMKILRMPDRFWIAGLFGIFLCAGAYAAPVSNGDAALAVRGWLQITPTPLGMDLSAKISTVDTVKDENGTTLYHVVSLEPEGYVICSADTGIEPVLAFSAAGRYEADSRNPLYILVEKDTRSRLQIIRAQAAMPAAAAQSRVAAKWSTLRVPANGQMVPAGSGLASLNDPRVDPFIQSRWDQSTVGGGACYNYYTPAYEAGNADNYVCGCNNTAWAQVMRYFQYPTRPVGTNAFQITVDGVSTNHGLRGGDGVGGAYKWNLMPLEPSDPSTAERQAIGALCADIGVASGTRYTAFSSSAWTTEQIVKDVFFYSNACYVYEQSCFAAAVRPSLDARLPVGLHIMGPDANHMVLSDGYGFNLDTVYYHLNMGWGGSADAWYNLPDIDTEYYQFDTIVRYIYNIYTNGTGEIISGRVLDGGMPVTGVVVSAVGGGRTNSTTTDARGIYALARLSSNTSFVLTAKKGSLQFHSLSVATGLSSSGSRWTGNTWSNDISKILTFTLTVASGSGAGSYTNGARVTITADVPSGGMAFSRWAGATQYVANITSSTTTVTMPAQNVSVTATYKTVGDYTYTASSGKITITRYAGPAGEATIPDVINGLPVTGIGSAAFSGCSSLTRITLPDSVTSIGANAFEECFGLTRITLGPNVASIGSEAFYGCSSLASITLPGSLTSIGGGAFYNCTGLSAVYFKGNPPGIGTSAFAGAANAVIYYLPGATGWGATFGGRRTVQWHPKICGASFDEQANLLRFTITGSSNLLMVVETCANLVDANWSPLETNMLTGGSSCFSDPRWTNYPGRFYHLRMP